MLETKDLASKAAFIQFIQRVHDGFKKDKNKDVKEVRNILLSRKKADQQYTYDVLNGAYSVSYKVNSNGGVNDVVIENTVTKSSFNVSSGAEGYFQASDGVIGGLRNALGKGKAAFSGAPVQRQVGAARNVFPEGDGSLIDLYGLRDVFIADNAISSILSERLKDNGYYEIGGFSLEDSESTVRGIYAPSELYLGKLQDLDQIFKNGFLLAVVPPIAGGSFSQQGEAAIQTRNAISDSFVNVFRGLRDIFNKGLEVFPCHIICPYHRAGHYQVLELVLERSGNKIIVKNTLFNPYGTNEVLEPTSALINGCVVENLRRFFPENQVEASRDLTENGKDHESNWNQSASACCGHFSAAIAANLALGFPARTGQYLPKKEGRPDIWLKERDFGEMLDRAYDKQSITEDQFFAYLSALRNARGIFTAAQPEKQKTLENFLFRFLALEVTPNYVESVIDRILEVNDFQGLDWEEVLLGDEGLMHLVSTIYSTNETSGNKILYRGIERDYLGKKQEEKDFLMVFVCDFLCALRNGEFEQSYSGELNISAAFVKGEQKINKDCLERVLQFRFLDGRSFQDVLNQDYARVGVERVIGASVFMANQKLQRALELQDNRDSFVAASVASEALPESPSLLGVSSQSSDVNQKFLESLFGKVEGKLEVGVKFKKEIFQTPKYYEISIGKEALRYYPDDVSGMKFAYYDKKKGFLKGNAVDCADDVRKFLEKAFVKEELKEIRRSFGKRLQLPVPPKTSSLALLEIEEVIDFVSSYEKNHHIVKVEKTYSRTEMTFKGNTLIYDSEAYNEGGFDFRVMYKKENGFEGPFKEHQKEITEFVESVKSLGKPTLREPQVQRRPMTKQEKWSNFFSNIEYFNKNNFGVLEDRGILVFVEEKDGSIHISSSEDGKDELICLGNDFFYESVNKTGKFKVDSKSFTFGKFDRVFGEYNEVLKKSMPTLDFTLDHADFCRQIAANPQASVAASGAVSADFSFTRYQC